MKTYINRKRKHDDRPVPCPYKRQQLESNHPEKHSKSHSFEYSQAFSLLQAIELNRRQRLSKKCLAHLALFVSQAWEDKPCQEKIQQLYYMMNNLLNTTGIDLNEPFEIALQKFCSSPVSTPTICPSVTLLIAISYVERLNKRYRNLKGTPGCASRMIMVAFIMASKYIHDSLRLIIYTNIRKPTNSIVAPITPPTSPKMPSHTSIQDRNMRIARMEQEFLFFLNYDLSVNDPSLLVQWAHSYEPNNKQTPFDYTSADEGDDEMDDEEP
ncbi:uncharacterized protein B0P05DRAFT_466016 [Gilbertella persicaria]|uniref:uncharacterized protein n=1 Tax=Gilbertella persicaria TaxID=101096 RepID=UPI00221E7129|nr:uncharacterized protein B0P05DRAFT_466016 [Gilbertella persicaria]KAI8087037.1 hypothetical protein B0P05DRAFT_466016 [Gilbertella persicaria]